MVVKAYTIFIFPPPSGWWVLVFNSLMLLILIHSSSLPTYPPCQSRSAATAPLQVLFLGIVCWLLGGNLAMIELYNRGSPFTC